ncbi:MAG: SIMPL domain-containing protein [Candidatus Rokuibacteriota bacterium]
MAALTDNRSAVVPAVIVGVCLVIGLSIGGYFVGRGAMRFRSDTRVVTVKGLVEREVKADQAVWTLGLRRASESLQDAHARISADRDAAVAFLRKQGFAEGEIERQPTRTVDKLAREYGQPQVADRFRYVVTTSVIVRTPNVDLVRTALGATEQLLKSGVVLDGEREGAANPRYVVSKFKDLRPQLLADATRNARATAQQFAADSGAQVGVIRSANQGSIQIFGLDGGNESAPFSPTSTAVKRIRVVSTFEFELR